jgi:protein regulator of cytokinesis 1
VNDNLLDRKIVSSLIDVEDNNATIRSTMENDNCTGIGSHSLDKLTKRVRELSAEKRRRKVVLANMGAEIGELWEKLHVSREDQQAFAESINGLGLDTIVKGEVELKRLSELKSVMMGKLISDARSTIRNLWDEIHSNEKEKSSFHGIDDLNFTDNLLAEHEKYIVTLENRLGQLQPLLVTIEKRENIIRVAAVQDGSLE